MCIRRLKAKCAAALTNKKRFQLSSELAEIVR